MPLLIQEKKLDTADKIQLIISYTLQVTIFIVAIISLIKGNWLNASLAGLALAMSLLPE